MSPPAVHHHFSSAGELKALAFVHLIRTLLDAGQVPPPATRRARLHAMLGSEDGGFEPYIKLWREAQILADRDPHIRDAYLLTMQMWHEETVTIIEQGKQAGEFTFTANATDIAAAYRTGVRAGRYVCAGYSGNGRSRV